MLATPAETAILNRVIRPDVGDMNPDAAKALLSFAFSEEDHRRMAELSARAQEGNLSPAEREELDGFINVNHFIAFIQSKARISLKGRGPSSTAA